MVEGSSAGMRSLAWLPATLGHKVCRELLQTVHERRPGEFLGMNDLGIAAQPELSRNSDSLTIPAHRESCFLCSHEGALLQLLFI